MYANDPILNTRSVRYLSRDCGGRSSRQGLDGGGGRGEGSVRVENNGAIGIIIGRHRGESRGGVGDGAGGLHGRHVSLGGRAGDGGGRGRGFGRAVTGNARDIGIGDLAGTEAKALGGELLDERLKEWLA